MKKRKKKIKIKKVFILFIIIILLGLLGYGYSRLSITNIYVLGNNILTEDEIIREADLITYPKIYQVSKRNIEQKLLQNDLIKEVNVSKSFFGKIKINIIENKILYRKNNNYILSNGKVISLDKDIIDVPVLLNDIDTDVENKFIEKMTLVNHDILIKISEIEYAKNELDDERFLFYMNDGNYVYITLSKINAVNNYNEIYPTLGGKKGILYLDSGNHFQIKE